MYMVYHISLSVSRYTSLLLRPSLSPSLSLSLPLSLDYFTALTWYSNIFKCIQDKSFQVPA